jgi:peptidoglycan/xylan/chitin deacetylase (PgdA/CDA1 family)
MRYGVYLVKTPAAFKSLASSLLWHMPRDQKKLYLTFDDGPHPESTSFVLDTLESHGAKATFFCIGGNAAKYPELYHRIAAQGHRTGNHTWNHMNGWEFSQYSYLRSALECAAVVKSNLFRPPYGRITKGQTNALLSRFRIVMWDVLSADWDQRVAPEKCMANVVRNAREGSIVVFHDSAKAFRNVSYALPRVLRHFAEAGYQFCSLP